MIPLRASIAALVLAAAPAYAEYDPNGPGGEICPLTGVAAAAVGEMGVVEAPDSGIGCALAPIIDVEKLSWLQHDVASVPGQLTVRFALDLSRAVFAPQERVEIVDVRAQTAAAPPITVSIAAQTFQSLVHPYLVRLAWGGPSAGSATYPLAAGTHTLSLWIDRATPDDPSAGFVKLLVDERVVLQTDANAAIAALPENGSAVPTRVRFGVLGVRDLESGQVTSTGAVFLRPLGVELRWPRQSGDPDVH